METLNDIVTNHPFGKLQRELRRQHVLEAFPDYVDAETFHDWHLVLYRFATTRPLIYYRPDAVSTAFDFLCRDRKLSLQAIIDFQRELTHAVMSLVRPGTSWNLEERLTLDGPREMFKIEQVWHPEYQRYCEHVFNHLINVFLSILGSRKSKDYVSSLTLANRVNVLSDNNLASLINGFDSTVRNAISHGSISFEMLEVIYRDKSDERRLDGYQFSELFDGLVDSCHSMLIALLLFVCSQKAYIEEQGLLRQLPLGLRYLLVDAMASHDYCQVLSMIESQVIGNRKQLNISCKIDIAARSTQIQEAIILCWHATVLGGQTYDRHSVTFDCGRRVDAALFLDGQVMQKAIDEDWTIEQCRAAKLVETELLWFDTSKFVERIHSWRYLLSIAWELRMKRELVKNWRQSGFKIWGSRYSVRHTINSSVNDIRRIEAYVILRERARVTDDEMCQIVRHIFRALKRRRIRGRDVDRDKGLPQRPNYVWVRLFASDRRIRAFSGGWHNKNQILMAEWFSPWKNRGPLLVKKPDIVFDNIRIKYNPTVIATK